uniref:Uncharacterized protein n=2 Tax=Otolemur garnettii TaxID=30611 RepID=H0XJU8_OTOGA
TDMAGGCVLVLVLLATVLTRTGAILVAKPLTALPEAKGCHLAQFKSFSPKELQAFKRIKDVFEESLLPEDCRGSSHLFPRPWSLRQLQVWERPVTLEAELALTLKVLEAVTKEALRDILDQPLHTLRHIQSQLQACGRVQPTAGPRLRGRLRNWLHQLQEAPKKESPGCLEASVIFNLFRLLTWDLKCVASGHLCA